MLVVWEFQKRSVVLVFVTKDQDIIKIHVAFVYITSQLNSCAFIF